MFCVLVRSVWLQLGCTRTTIVSAVGIQHFEDLRELERDLRSAALVLSRAATDTGRRTDLDSVISGLGFSREELLAELREDQAAGRE